MEHNMNVTRSERLSDAAVAAVASLAHLGDAERRAALKMLGITRGHRVWAPRGTSDLPTLTALVPARDRDAIYGSTAWAGAYRWATTRVAYIVQARGLARLSADLGGHSLAKVGTSAPEIIGRRWADLGATEYGAYHRAPRGYERRPGFDVFLPAPRLQLAAQHPLSPVRLSTLGVEVGLPPGLSPDRFEADLNRRLSPLRLHVFGDSEAGCALRARTGLPATALRRFYKTGGRFKAATEITLFRPQADVGALARLCADIVIDAVLGLLGRRPGR